MEMDPNVIMAAERTLLAWIRTSLAMMGLGFVVARFSLFIREMGALGGGTGVANGPPYSLWIGVALVALGVIVAVVATFDYVRRLRRIEAKRPPSSMVSFFSVTVAILLSVVGIGMAVYLISMK